MAQWPPMDPPLVTAAGAGDVRSPTVTSSQPSPLVLHYSATDDLVLSLSTTTDNLPNSLSSEAGVVSSFTATCMLLLIITASFQRVSM